MAKQIKKSTPQKVQSAAKNLLDYNYVALGLLGIFWLVFFRELISGNAYLFDDFIEQYYPGKFMASVMLSKGLFPFWNPFAFSGVPFFADLQIAVLYPFNFILQFFVKNDKLSALAIQNTIVFHYLLTSVFTFFLAKHFKLSGLFSTLFALLFTYSSYMMIHMMHQPLIEAATWLPLFFLLWLKFTDTKKYLYAVLAGLIMTLCVLAGYPQVPFFNFFFIGVYTLFIAYGYYREKKNSDIVHLFLGLAVSLIFTFGLTAFQLLPALEFIGVSNRASFDYEFAKQGSMHIYDYITLIIPKYFGVWSGNEKITDIQYWSKHSEGPWMFSISNIFLSTIIVILFYPSLNYFIKEKKNVYLAYFALFIIIFTFFFSLGGNFFFHKLLFDFVPFFNRFRNPAHVVYIMMMAVILITMIGTNGIVSSGKVKEYFTNKYLFSVAGILFFFFLIVYTGMLLPAYASQSAQIVDYVKSQSLTFLLFSFAFAVIIYLYSNGKLNSNTFGLLIVLVLLFEIYQIWFAQNNGTKNLESLYLQRSQIAEKLKQEMKSEIFRVNSRHYNPSAMLFQRNQGYIDNIELLEGYGALLLKDFIPPNGVDTKSRQSHDLMNVKYHMTTDSVQKSPYLGRNETFLPRVMMFFDAVKFDNDSLAKNYMTNSGFDYRRTLVVTEKENMNLPKLNADEPKPVASVRIYDRDINSMKVEVNTPRDGLLYFSEVYYPAFKSYVDGQHTKILKADYCMRAVQVPAGNHVIEMKYESDEFSKGLMITLITAGLFIISVPASVFLSRRKKSSGKNENSD